MCLEKNKATFLIVGCHKDKVLLEEPKKTPYDLYIQAGAALTDIRKYSVNDYDDFDENISGRNDRYSEMTAVWWARYNVNTDYIGIEHYRRRFEADISVLEEAMDNGADVITITYATFPKPVNEYVGEFDFMHPFYVSMDIIKEFHPEDYALAEEIMSGNKLHPCNMNIWRKEVFFEYSDWLFPMLNAFYERIPEKRDNYLHRDVGFFAERATSIYVEKLLRMGAKVYTSGVKIYRSEEQDESEPEYNDMSEFDKYIEDLYQKKHTITCRNAIVNALPHMNEDARYIGLLYMRVFDIYTKERRYCERSLFEYLPPEYRDTIKRCSDMVTALYLSIDQVIKSPTADSEKVFVEIIEKTHFSGAAVSYMLESFFKGENIRKYIVVVLKRGGFKYEAETIERICREEDK